MCVGSVINKIQYEQWRLSRTLSLQFNSLVNLTKTFPTPILFQAQCWCPGCKVHQDIVSVLEKLCIRGAAGVAKDS